MNYTVEPVPVGYHSIWQLKHGEAMICSFTSRIEADKICAILQSQQETISEREEEIAVLKSRIEERDADIAVWKSRFDALQDRTISQGTIAGINPMAGRKYKEDGQ
jgi:hypothetical protein